MEIAAANIFGSEIFFFHNHAGYKSDLFLFCGIVCNPTPDKSHRKEKICFWSADLDHDVARPEQKQIQIQMKIKIHTLSQDTKNTQTNLLDRYLGEVQR